MTSPAGITVYWRPGCLFCSSLFRDLDRWSIPYQAGNIWEDPAAALDHEPQVIRCEIHRHIILNATDELIG